MPKWENLQKLFDAMKKLVDNPVPATYTYVEWVNAMQVLDENTTCGFPESHASICPMKQGDQAYLTHLPIMKKFW